MRFFLDSSVIIFGLEKPGSNSGTILETLVNDEFEFIINEKVIRDVKKYVRNRKGRQAGFLVESLLRAHTFVANEQQFMKLFEPLRKEIKEKDVEHLATARGMGIGIIVAYDRDFEEIKEYLTPKEFIVFLGREPSDSEY